MTKPHYWDEAKRALAERDRVLATLIAAYPEIHLTRRGDPFTTLARAIVGQQISVRAAQTIWDRLLAACGSGSRGPLDPQRVQRKRIATLRKCGLSERKAEYIRDLARHFVSARLDPQVWPALDDEALIEALVDVKGIGRWTAEMFLMFHEMRANVLPSTTSACRRPSRRITSTARDRRSRNCASSASGGSRIAASRRGTSGGRSIRFRWSISTTLFCARYLVPSQAMDGTRRAPSID
jgi:DNA-3-methyladenine glycosylase II